MSALMLQEHVQPRAGLSWIKTLTRGKDKDAAAVGLSRVPLPKVLAAVLPPVVGLPIIDVLLDGRSSLWGARPGSPGRCPLPNRALRRHGRHRSPVKVSFLCWQRAE